MRNSVWGRPRYSGGPSLLFSVMRTALLGLAAQGTEGVLPVGGVCPSGSCMCQGSVDSGCCASEEPEGRAADVHLVPRSLLKADTAFRAAR